jgi:tetratricopeptide (TPR) repeat protein
MNAIKRFFEFIILVFFMAMFLGCATSNYGNVQSKDVIPVGYKYYPKLPPGITSLDAARKDLDEFLKDEKISSPGIKYYGQPDINEPGREKDLKKFFEGSRGKILACENEKTGLVYLLFTKIAVLDYRIDIGSKINLFYTDLLDKNIIVEKRPDMLISVARRVSGYAADEMPTYGGTLTRPYEIYSTGLISFHFQNLADAQRFADDLYFIQQTLKKKHDERLVLFESKAAQYRALKVKPPVSEELRSYIVQANVLNQQKDYAGAIDLYLKAVELDPVSYPGAYFNLALLSAQMQRFQSAIGYMKQYLVLAPDAPDARSAQDKIYEWEIMMIKKSN